ncbi:MAG: isoprenylcysteine carboxylmethyltransferase family protein [Pseudomonadota bacterium]|jgi:protein-S-isoprenylcysteine O-methyltransferase Ste14|nr:isoprenylcysteine carboxylmethyltransferase family protein [Pseudomonadota bacterium]
MNFFTSKTRTLGSRIIGLILIIILSTTASKWHNSSLLVEHLLWFTGWFLVGLGVMGRIWCSLYISGFKDSKLVTYGPYSICRNPLYVFSYLGALGVMFLTETLFLPIAFTIIFIIYYHFVINQEEKFLTRAFPEQYAKYCETTPRFWPSFRNYYEPERYEVSPKHCRKFLAQVIWFVWLAACVQLFEELRMTGVLPVWLTSF